MVAWAYDAGATDLGPGPTPRVEPILLFRAEGGLGPSADGIAWQSAEAAPDALDPAHAERDAWAVTLPSLAVGSWVAGFRFSLDAGATWQTCGTVAVLVRPSPCDPNPCVASASVACEGDVVATRPALGSCAVVGHDAQCSYPVERLDCAALGGRCEAGACVDVATWPEPGEVVVSEIMRNPNLVDDSVGEWLELVDLAARPVQLAGCTLSDDGTDLIALEDDAGALTMWPTGRLVLAASADPSQNGGVAADWGWAGHGKFELLNNADAVVLRCGGHVIDTVRYSSLGWPSTAGRAMQLSPRKEDADLNDDGDAWCSAASAIGGATFPDYGTPGAANSPCPEAVERCRFVAPAELDAVGGAPFTVAVQVRHAGLTDLSAGVDADPLLKVEAGLGPAGWYPTWGGWTFVAATPDPDWSDLAPPMEDQWLATLVADPDDDAVDAAGRVSVDGGLTWTSCDRDSTLPGGDGSQDGYSPSNATRVTVVAPDPCLPNPCTNPPATACDADGSLVSYPALGACRADVDGASCDYAQDVVDCTALGGTCDAAARACVGALAHPGPGDLVVSEVMASPAAVADFFGEWFELTSVSGVDVNLAGCSLEDSESALTIDRPGHALVVLAGARVVLGRDAASVENGGVAVDYAWGDGLGLGNAGDRIAIVCDGAIVDEVVWDQAFPLGPGVAMQLDPGLVGAELNDASSAWCAAESAYGAGDLGTPGLANATCPP
ncbi:MAG: lamin tail domain-containing protein [Myxococcota bacterium]